MTGTQMGFVNTAEGGMIGLQFGFINTAVKSSEGVQLGLINTNPARFNGAQIALINTTKQLNGLQLGLINYSDSVEKGLPIGLLSIVKEGAYKAIETGASEIAPFNIAFKIGIEKFYTSFILTHNPYRKDTREQTTWGAGFGSIVQLSKPFYLNPEITAHNTTNSSCQNYVSAVSYFGYNINPHLSIAAGPAVAWAYNDKSTESPFVGARLALRFRW
jgi:hypothetical protein